MKVKVTYWREADGKYLGYLNDNWMRNSQRVWQEAMTQYE